MNIKSREANKKNQEFFSKLEQIIFCETTATVLFPELMDLDDIFDEDHYYCDIKRINYETVTKIKRYCDFTKRIRDLRYINVLISVLKLLKCIKEDNASDFFDKLNELFESPEIFFSNPEEDD